jgi:hypothetical protein
MASGLAAGSCALLRGCWVFGASREVTCSGRREEREGPKCAEGSRYVPTADLRIAASARFGFTLSAWEKRDCCRGARRWCAHRPVRTAGGTPGGCFWCARRLWRTSGQVQIAECKVQSAKWRIPKAVSFRLSAVSRNAAACETSLPLTGFDSDAYRFTAYGSEQCVFQRDATWNHRHE